MDKLNTGQILKINAMAMDTLGLKVPQILKMIGLDITDKEYLDERIEAYGNNFYDWLNDYVNTALPSYGGGLPSTIVDNDEVRNFVYDLLMNFYIARMLVVELNSPYTDVPPETE